MEDQQTNTSQQANTPQDAQQARESNERIVALIQEKIKELNTNYNINFKSL